jgi:hypothetical protein
MAMYQIPQFLDSGDKVFFSLNFIQLIYLLVGFFSGIGVFYFVQFLFPALGIYAIVPAIPFFLVFLYLSIGRFNGRDTYLYVGKFIKLFTTSPHLTYEHQADLTDLYEKFGSLDIDTKLKEFDARYETIKTQKEKEMSIGTVERKTQYIKELGSNLDANYINTSAYIAEKDAKLKSRQDLLDDLISKNRPKNEETK